MERLYRIYNYGGPCPHQSTLLLRPGVEAGGDSDYICKLSLWHADPDEYGITTKSMKNYLKMNKIKGYSNKTKRELVTMCISF